MEHKSPLPHSQQRATCPYPEPDRSSPCPSSHFLEINLNIKLPSTSGSSKWSFPSNFPTKPCMHLSPTHATCPANLILGLIMFCIQTRRRELVRRPEIVLNTYRTKHSEQNSKNTLIRNFQAGWNIFPLNFPEFTTYWLNNRNILD